ncbi:MAG: hypothetical protein AB7E60_02705 [Sphingobium sp.]
MAFEDLTDLKCQVPEPSMPDYGVLQSPVLNGPSNKIDRLGGGFLIKYSLPPEMMEPDGRRIVARCMLAKRFGAILAYPQVEFAVGTPGNVITVAGAHDGGMAVAITGATPDYAVRLGQALNIIRHGHPYLYFAARQVVLDGSGAGSIPLTTPLRTKLLGAEPVNLVRPVIAGWITGDNFSWPIDMQRTVGLSFDLQERA